MDSLVVLHNFARIAFTEPRKFGELELGIDFLIKEQLLLTISLSSEESGETSRGGSAALTLANNGYAQ
ncbi:hypothetical protein Tco_0529093 [Tanacetum coccineum]